MFSNFPADKIFKTFIGCLDEAIVNPFKGNKLFEKKKFAPVKIEVVERNISPGR